MDRLQSWELILIHKKVLLIVTTDIKALSAQIRKPLDLNSNTDIQDHQADTNSMEVILKKNCHTAVLMRQINSAEMIFFKD